MYKKEMFYSLCKAMANLEDATKMLEDIGLIVEPTGFGHKIYNTCDILCNIAINLLDMPNSIDIKENIIGKISSATNETVNLISEEVWNKYGKKNVD